MTVESTENKEKSISEKSNNIEAEYSDLYPGRKKIQTRTWLDKLFLKEKREQLEKTQCELNVYQCVQDSKIFTLTF